MKLKLKEMRKSRKLSQQDMADLLNVKLRTYASWERQENNLSLENAVKIAKCLNISLDKLCGRENKDDLLKQIQDNKLRSLIINYNQLAEEYQYQIISLTKALNSNPDNRKK